jgi:uncharacterized membrane protein|tara:strand:- start:192 stop:461 length:270 start_codon:yes stop_codon:yes gene_type:complete
MKSNELLGQKAQASKKMIEREEKRKARNGFARNFLLVIWFIVLAVVLPTIAWPEIMKGNVVVVVPLAIVEIAFIGLAILIWQCAKTWRK